MSRSEQVKNDFQSILSRWKEALDQDESELTRDAAILRFELTFEVGWKLIQVLAREEGYEAQSPRQAFQQAYSLGWVSDEVVWSDIIKARNTATHVYRETYAKVLYDKLDEFYSAFKELQESIE